MRTLRELSGWALLLVVVSTPFAVLALLIQYVDDDFDAGYLPFFALLLALSWPRMWLSARRLREPVPEEVAEADARAPVVLLHRFARVAEPLSHRLLASPALARELRDAWLERAITRRLRGVGPVVPLARPAPAPEHGPVRPTIDAEWARTLDRALRRARMSAIVLDGSEANAHEIDRARALLGLARTILIVPEHLPSARYEALRARYAFLPPRDARARAIRFDVEERPYLMAEPLLRDDELVPEPKAPASSFLLAALAVFAGLFAAIATPIVLEDRFRIDDGEAIGWGVTTVILGILLAFLSRRAVQLVPANEAVMVTVAAIPWLAPELVIWLSSSDVQDEWAVRSRLEHTAVGAAYAAPLLGAAAVLLACSALLRTTPSRRPAYAIFGVAALLPFAPLALSLERIGADTSTLLVALIAGAVGLGLSAWAASGEPLRANAPLPIGAAVAAAACITAWAVVVDHDTFGALLGIAAEGGLSRIPALPEMLGDLSTFGAAWPWFALVGPAVVVLVGAQFPGRSSPVAIGNLAAFAPLILLFALASSTRGVAYDSLALPGSAQMLASARGTLDLSPGFVLPLLPAESTSDARPADVILDPSGVIVGGSTVARIAELGLYRSTGGPPALARSLFALSAQPERDPHLRVAAHADLSAQTLRDLAAAARRAGWRELVLMGQQQDGQPGTVSLGIAGQPTELGVRFSRSQVAITSQSGAYVPVPHVNGAVDQQTLRYRLWEQRQQQPNLSEISLVLEEDVDIRGFTVKVGLLQSSFPTVVLVY